MAFKQTVNPNLDPYIYIDGKILTDWLGWCLAYVERAFGHSSSNAYARLAWNNSKTKHADRNLPKGVYVPLHFSHTGTYSGVTRDWGHIVIYKDGVIWSSPISRKPYADKFYSIEAVERAFNAKYLGWTEDVSGKRVIEALPEPYAGKAITPVKMELIKAVGKYDLTFTDWGKVRTVSTHPQGAVETIVGQYTHKLGGKYLITEADFKMKKLFGFNAVDLKPYVEPKPEPKTDPAPTPTPKPAPSKITYQAITPKVIELVRDANLWNFDFTKWGEARAVKNFKAGEKLEVVAIATNALSAKYYMTEDSFKTKITNGVNVNDCRDYVAPNPVEPPKPEPEPKTEPVPVEPEPKPDLTAENNSLLRQIVELLNWLVEKVRLIFK